MASETSSLDNFLTALANIRSKMQPLTLMNRDEAAALLRPSEEAKLNVALAYSLTSLFYMYLRSQGADPAAHPVKSGLVRVQGYVQRLNKLEAAIKEAAKGGVEGQAERLQQALKKADGPTMRIDQAASRRFIDAALAGDDVWGKNSNGRGGGGGDGNGSGSASKVLSKTTAVAKGKGVREEKKKKKKKAKKFNSSDDDDDDDDDESNEEERVCIKKEGEAKKVMKTKGKRSREEAHGYVDDDDDEGEKEGLRRAKAGRTAADKGKGRRTDINGNCDDGLIGAKGASGGDDSSDSSSSGSSEDDGSSTADDDDDDEDNGDSSGSDE